MADAALVMSRARRAGRTKPTILVARGLIRHCPNCGASKLFASWFRMLPRCPKCGLRFEREEGFFLGAFVINFAVTEIATAISIAVSIVATLPHPPASLLAVIVAVVTIVVPVVFYPFSRTIWAAIDLVMKPIEARDMN